MKYVIIGGDAAGMSAAMQLLKHDLSAEITILEQGAVYSYAQCGMPYVINGVVKSVNDLVVRSVETYRNKFGMDARVHHQVEKVDTEEKLVSGRNVKTGESFCIRYDKLLTASGGSSFIPNWKGVDLQGVYSVKTLADVEAIMKKVENGIEDVTIVGGGYVGLEMAESFRLLGKRVRILIRSRQVAKTFDEEMAKLIEEEAERHGIEILYEEVLEEIIGEHFVTSVRTNKRTYETDVVLVAAGLRPNTEFLKETGIHLAKNGAIYVNEWMETNVVDVYAAGDCAMQYDRITQVDEYTPLGTHANKQGRVAGLNMAGKHRAFKGITGTSILKFMDLALGKTGLSDREAFAAGIAYLSMIVRSKTHASYYPNARSLTVKLTFRREDGLLLGGQVIGKAGVDKRIDVLSTALFNEMTVEELEDLDLSYAPPFNSTWDPIQRAARKAVAKLEDK